MIMILQWFQCKPRSLHELNPIAQFVDVPICWMLSVPCYSEPDERCKPFPSPGCHWCVCFPGSGDLRNCGIGSITCEHVFLNTESICCGSLNECLQFKKFALWFQAFQVSMGQLHSRKQWNHFIHSCQRLCHLPQAMSKWASGMTHNCTWEWLKGEEILTLNTASSKRMLPFFGGVLQWAPGF